MLSPFPPSHTLPSYPRFQHPPCPLSQATTIGSSIMVARRQYLRLARSSADSSWLQCWQTSARTFQDQEGSTSCNINCGGDAWHSTRTDLNRPHFHINPKYSFQSSIHTSLTAVWALSIVNPQPWRFTNNSLGLPPPIPCLFARFYESVSCVYAFLSTSLSTCVASAAWFVFGSVFINIFLFTFLFFYEYNRYLCHGALDVRIRLLICLSPFSRCIFIILIPAYVYLNIHRLSLLFHIRTQLSPYSYVYIVLCSIYIPICWFSFFLFRNLIDTCVTVSIYVMIPWLISLSSTSFCISTL